MVDRKNRVVAGCDLWRRLDRLATFNYRRGVILPECHVRWQNALHRRRSYVRRALACAQLQRWDHREAEPERGSVNRSVTEYQASVVTTQRLPQ